MKFFRTDAEKEFNVEFITSPEIENLQQRCCSSRLLLGML